MAAPRAGSLLPLRSYWLRLFCLVAGCLTSAALDLPSQEILNSMASNVAKELSLLTEEATGRGQLEDKYNEQNFFLEPVHGDDALDEAIEKLGPIFQQRVKAVQEIAKRAEQLASIHQIDEELTAQRVSFINGLAKEWDDGTIRNDSLASLPQFPRPIRLHVNSSAIRFPTHVYEGWMWHKFKPLWWEDVGTLNALMWTDGLDATFIENMRRDPTLHWQYFATRDGMLRYYPAHKWHSSTNHADSYDARQRPWFTQSLSSAKDLIILVDVSGSIHGPTFEILKISVKRLLGTLTEYDYFNVIQFNETATWLVPCFETLVPATTHNKRMVYQALDHIVPHGKASWANALAFTYKQLVKFQSLRSTNGLGKGGSSNCHQAIVLISDGGTEFPQEQLEMIRNDSRLPMTRVFTLAVGPHPIPTTNMRNISCFAHGLHAAVINYGAIPSKVRNYLQVLNRPLALSRDESLIDWSLSYADGGGLGTVLTVSKPVYNLDPNGSQSILGVAAVDIPTSLFDLALPDSQLGFAGYKMVITPAGNAVVHPRLHLQIAYTDDPLMVNFEDLEPSGNWSDSLRRMVIDRRNGSQSFTTSDLIDDAHYLVDQKRTWFLKPIAKSAYMLAVSVVNGTNLIVPNVELLHKVPWNANLMTRAAPWNFCSHLAQNVSSPKEYLNQLSQRYERDGTGCDHTALGHLLWDLELTANVSHLWKNDQRFTSRFVSTLGGITRMERSALRFLQNDLIDPRNSSIFLRLAHSEAKLLISPPIHQEESDDFLIAAKVVAKGQLMALVGSSVTKDTLQSLWAKVTGTSFKPSDNVHLYWLDEGAHVIASNQMEVRPGTFIGSKHADPQLMKALLSENPYPSPPFRQADIVQQSVDCPVPPKMPVSAASFLSAKWPRNIFKALTGTVNLIWALLASLVTGASATTPVPMELELDQLRPPKIATHLCTKRYVVYQLQTMDGALSRSFACSSLCSSGNQSNQEAFVRMIRVAQVPNTRSILVASTPPCQCPNPVFHQGLIGVDDQMDKCLLPSRYRKSTKTCYSKDSREKALECGCQSLYSGRMLIPSMLFTFFIVWILR